MPVRKLSRGTWRLGVRLTRLAIKAVAALLLILVTIMVVQAWNARAHTDPEPWHHAAPAGEFEAADATETGFDLDRYRRMEDELFANLDDFRVDRESWGPRSEFIRFLKGGPVDPEAQEQNWNRTFELVPESSRGGALLLHGLTDSPYSFRSIAELLHEQGFYVLCLRLPGHGTVPAALLDVSWKDWVAAANVAAAHVRSQISPEQPFIIGGYSMGGAVAMHHAVSALGTAGVPDRVVLFSPAIGITPFARASNIHKLVSWIPYFEEYRWLSIEPEFDPFKYNSFPKNGGAQMWGMTRALARAVADAEGSGQLGDMPPILAFQSIVDDTVVARELWRLFQRLPEAGNELIVFDVNNSVHLEGFFHHDFRPALAGIEADTTLPFRLSIVTNADPDSVEVVERTKPPRSADIEVRPLDLSWPRGVYSLAHVAIPFPPDDPMYGVERDGHATLGSLTLRGERRVLRVSADHLLRLRHNPFHEFIRERLLEVLEGDDP